MFLNDMTYYIISPSDPLLCPVKIKKRKKIIKKKERVFLDCTVKNCPRSKTIPKDDTMPKNTYRILLPCGWHCGGESWERYFDKKNNELFL